MRINDLSQHVQATKREQIQAEQLAVEHERNVWKATVDALQQELSQEKHDKDAQQQWQLKFVACQPGLNQPQAQLAVVAPATVVDPADDVIAKFAQNIALLPSKCAAKVTRVGALPFLTHLLREDLGDLVTGSVLLALVHLAINEKPQRPPLHKRTLLPVAAAAADADSELRLNVKDEIIKTGAAAPLVLILEQVRNPRVAVEAARLCAALASHIPNKRVLAAKNAVRFLTNLLVPRATGTGNNSEDCDGDDEAVGNARMEKLPLPGDDETQRTALSALVNLSYGTTVQPITLSVFCSIDHHS